MATTTAPKAATGQAQSTTGEWLRLARGGAIVMAVWSIALQGFAQSLIPPVAVIGLVFLGFVPFLKGERRTLGLVVVVFGVLAVAGNLEIILDELRNPESAPAFVLNLLSLVGVSLAVVGGLSAFLRRPAHPVRTVAVAAAGVFVAGSVASFAIAAGTPSETPLPGDVQVTAHQVMWAPETIALDASDGGLWIDNQDGIRHTFTIPQLGIDVEVPALKARRVDLDAPPGEYQIICTVPGHESMTGTLTIEG
jgi:plastocyanin